MRKACNCLLLALLIQVVASCGNLNVSELSKDCSDNSIKTLTITSGDQSVAKTILPEALDCASLTYYFAIENLISKKQSLQVFTAENDDYRFNFPIELESGYYKIGVYAIKAEDVAGFPQEKYGKLSEEGGYNDGDLEIKCVLAGNVVVDLRQDETVSIKLSANGLQQTGNVNLNFYTPGWTLDTTKFNAYCDIINKAGTRIGESTLINGITSAPPAADTWRYTAANINAGTYTFRVRYISKDNPSIVYMWSDTIMVLSNQTIKQVIPLPDIIDHAPAAPTDFRASYYDFGSGSVWCYVNFTWTDNSVNEAGFKIDIRAVHDSVADVDISEDMETAWSVAFNPGEFTGSYTIDNFDNDGAGGEGIRKDGSLSKNKTSATFKLSRGVRYLARISAVGYDYAGNSDYCYLDFSAGTGKAGYYDFDTSAWYIKVGN
ncbi:MAG: hypothetical protein IK015_12390 [Treponema sp.]|nr:hypothetical protein [Treponema sp.]